MVVNLMVGARLKKLPLQANNLFENINAKKNSLRTQTTVIQWDLFLKYFSLCERKHDVTEISFPFCSVLAGTVEKKISQNPFLPFQP